MLAFFDFSWLQTTGGSVPILSVSVVFTLCTAAVGYGMQKGKTDANAKAIASARAEMDRRFNTMIERFERKIDALSSEMGDLRQEVGTIRGTLDMMQRMSGHG